MGVIGAEAEAISGGLRRAFGGVRRGRITLHEAEVIDNYGPDEGRADARPADVDRRWVDVPDDHVAGCPWSLPHLDPVSWRYYVPAYMIWSLRHEDGPGNLAHGFITYTFDISPGLVDYALARFEALTPDQSAAVTRFLRFRAGGASGDPAAERALTEYWGRLGSHGPGYRPSNRG